MNAQYFHPDLVRFAFVAGIVVSVMYYERRHMTTGGIAVPGYLAFAIFDPLIAPGLVLVALASHAAIHHGLARVMLLPNAAKFSLTILASSFIHLALDLLLVTYASIQASSPLLRGIGYVVPGLVAHDFARQGVRKTMFNVGASSVIVAAALLVIVSLFPETARLRPSPVIDAFPVELAYLPLLVFLSLIAWLGVVRLQGLRCGGFLGGAYLTLLVLQPEELLRFLCVALVTLAVVRVLLDPVTILFGRRRFAAHMLVGACLSWAALRVSELYLGGDTVSVATPSLAVLGVLLTGLLASDMDRVGVARTLLGGFFSVAFTLMGTLFLLEITTYQRPGVAGPLLALFLAGAALMTLRPARLDAVLARIPGGRQRHGNGEGKHA